MTSESRPGRALPKCRGCGATLNAQTDSDAHIIPNALGGRLKTKGIGCQTCNTKLDEVADNSLIEAFGDWPTLLDIPRDRGSNPTKLIETRNGRRVRLKPDGSMTAVDVKYDVTPIPDGHEVRIAAGARETFRNLLKRAGKTFHSSIRRSRNSTPVPSALRTTTPSNWDSTSAQKPCSAER